MPNLEDIAFKVIITKNPDYDIVFRTILLGASASQMAYNNSSSGLEATTVQGAIDELKTDIDDLLPQILPKGEASGSIASFETDYEYPLLKCECEFSASQASGTPTPSAPIPIVGVSAVQVTRAGKNLLSTSYKSGYYNTNGMWVNNSSYGSYDITLKAGTYTFSTDLPNCYIIRYFIDTTETVINTEKQSQTFTLAKESRFRISFRNISTTEITAPNSQLELGSTATEYEPYKGTTALINLGGTYYGGEVDAVTGKITLTHQLISYTGAADENWSIVNQGEANQRFRLNPAYSGMSLVICSHCQLTNTNTSNWGYCRFANNYFVLTDSDNQMGSVENLKSWLATQYANGTPLSILVELATPIVVYASNTAEIPTIVGDNQVFADTGDVEVVYIESINNAIDQKLAELTASMIAYNNTASGLTATNVQNAIDEVASSGNRSTLASLLRGSEDMREDNSLPLSEEAEREEMREPESTEER